MPIVFVHGVNVRRGQDYDAHVLARDGLFRRILLRGLVPDPGAIEILSPYWGDRGAQPAWNHASLPGADAEVLGGVEELGGLLEKASQRDATDPVLLTLARRHSLVDAVDALWMAGALGLEDETGARQHAELAVRLLDYAAAHPNPDWLADVDDDEAFLERLRTEVERHPGGAADVEGIDDDELEVLGFGDLWDRIREGADRIAGTLGNVSGAAALAMFRSRIQEHVTRFLGDVFVYLKARGSADAPGPIPEMVIDSLEAGAAARTDDDPLLVVAHSMGGNIVYDVLTHFRPDLRVDRVVTVGSQVAFFEELKLFHASEGGVPDDQRPRVGRPDNVTRWLNVFDRTDVLAFAMDRVFAGVVDYQYDTGEGLIAAHGAYFTRPSFHRRLAKRMED